MKDGLITLGAAVPRVALADPKENAAAVIERIRAAAREGVRVLVLPELCLTGYTCSDLFYSRTLLDSARDALLAVAAATREEPVLAFVGVPLELGGKLYNCAAAVSGGMILGVVPKSNIPNYEEFYEARQFTPAPGADGMIRLGHYDVPFGTHLLFSCREMPALTVGCEICEDLWVADPPSVRLAAAGATVIVNLSASNETVGKDDYRRMMVRMQSGRLLCAYVYADCGEGESTTDLVFSGHCMIGEGGALAAENPPFGGRTLTACEVDLFHLLTARRRMNTWRCAPEGYRTVLFSLPVTETRLTRPVNPLPFVPSDGETRAQRCRRILDIQSRGLARRMEAAHAKGLVVAVSGGLDSCLALLVAARAADHLGRGRECIRTVTMPCYGTTTRTRSNAETLSVELGTRFSQIDIAEAVAVHFRDIGHDPENHNVAYENSQARERTQIIMDLANEDGSLVVGTGDLSELALGWATYNGDHMSNYGVNAGVPKTLVRHIVAFCADEAEENGQTALAAVLRDILATPVSPELLPAKDGEISQRTEDIVGPYELHDFFLYRILRFGESPAKIFRMACAAFDGVYAPEVILSWLRTFVRRFFMQQFKRSCLPDGPKIGSASLSPRGDWRMPSDASARLWLAECDALVKKTAKPQV